MSQWEYQVIHLNVDGGTPPAGGASGPGGAGSEGKAPGPQPTPFTKSYLEQEFPEHYRTPGAPIGPEPPQHPARQLQTFLNGHGAQGWSLVGIFPLGTLLMMIFRRRLTASLEAGTPPGVTEAPAAPPEAAPETPDLMAVLQRLEALESRLEAPDSTPPAEAPKAPAKETTLGPSPGGTSADGTVLRPAQLQRFAGVEALTTLMAAQALGYRSAASLANHGARHGYTPGLVKLGPNGQAAIYRGQASGQGVGGGGGKDRRLWIVVPSAVL